jgi:hypothetical protein
MPYYGKACTARVTHVAAHQTGRTHIVPDRQRRAMAPGMRVSRTGNKYYEARRNRSDLKGARKKRF